MSALQRVVVVVVAASCAHTEPPLARLENATAQVRSARASPRHLALAGLGALVISGDVKTARAWLDASVAKDGKEPWGHLGQMILAARDADTARGLEAALNLCQGAPGHPLAAVAARAVLEQAGRSSASDARLAERIPAVLPAVAGDAAFLLRLALVRASVPRQAPASARRAAAEELGLLTAGTLMGPFSVYHRLALHEPTPVERDGNIAPIEGPTGRLLPRPLSFADATVSLSGEPRTLDVYVLAADVTVPRGGRWVLRTVTPLDHVVTLDGAEVLSRLTWEHPASTTAAAVVQLQPGVHRLMVRMAREEAGGPLTLALSPLDGTAAGLAVSPARGPAGTWRRTPAARQDATGVFPTAGALFEVLRPEAGEGLARFVAAMDGMGRDPDGSADLLEELPARMSAPTVQWVKARLELADRSVAARVSRGRAARELEAALAREETFIAAHLERSALALEDGRNLEALAEVDATGSAATAPVLLARARAQLALGLDAAAAATVRPLRSAGVCEAVLLEYDLARRRDAVAEADAALERAAHCEGAHSRAAEHLRSRGQLAAAEAQYRAMLASDESQLDVALSLAGALSAQRRFADAVAVLSGQAALWPRSAPLLKVLADVHEQAGSPRDALAARDAALALDGADLSLRRAVERARTGKEPLAEEAISTEEALRSYEAAPGSEDATSAFVLDFAAIRAYPDGSMVDRVHIIQKALDQQGVSEIAEVQIPRDAQLLTLRTIKPDGRSLDPESIEGKDAISLPGVAVGDLVEYEYLLAHPSRGPAMPGFTASNFYFQIARQPNARSTYVVKAPRDAGLGVDAHNVKAPAVALEGELEVFRHEERRVPPYIPEPEGPPSPTEWLPFVSVGAGATGQDELVRGYADTFLDRGQVTSAVRRFAREAAGGASGRAAVEKVYAAVMGKLSQADLGLTMSAAASVAMDRGSRTWLMYAALKALGFPVRLAAVRTYATDPAPYRYPAEGLYTYVCVVVDVDKARLWLDPLVRYAPFGELPEVALGGQDAVLLPEPGRPLEHVPTPPRTKREGKQITLTMKLSSEGTLSGDAEERYLGFEAATVSEALESLSTEQRDQALQTGLSRYFGGADLSGLQVETRRDGAVSLTLRFHFEARGFARVEAGGRRMVARSLTYPQRLGQRYILTSARTTPLFIDATEASTVSATLELPEGMVLRGPVAPVTLSGPPTEHGAPTFTRSEAQEGRVLSVKEDFLLPQARIAPKDYEAFAHFAAEVDLLQQRDLLFERP